MVRKVTHTQYGKLRLLSATVGKSLLLLLAINLLNLIVEIYRLNMGEDILVSYDKGYVTLNSVAVGLNIATNLIAFLSLSSISLFNSQKQNLTL